MAKEAPAQQWKPKALTDSLPIVGSLLGQLLGGLPLGQASERYVRSVSAVKPIKLTLEEEQIIKQLQKLKPNKLTDAEKLKIIQFIKDIKAIAAKQAAQKKIAQTQKDR